ncbi:MAG TPA: c-type cytochrome [Pyrinomonadaceae bacterium]
MRKIILSVISTLVVIGLLVGGLLLYVRGEGFSAREQPSWMERTMARNARTIATPAGAKNLMNPRQQQTAEMLAEADEHFVEHCGICHGIDGHGDTLIGKNLYPKVPDMSQPDTQQLSDGELYYIIGNGIRLTGMPAWRFEDKPEAIWDLVSLIRRLPKLSPEELQRLQKAAREAGGELAEQAPEEKKEPGEATKEAETKPRHTHIHKH